MKVISHSCLHTPKQHQHHPVMICLSHALWNAFQMCSLACSSTTGIQEAERGGKAGFAFSLMWILSFGGDIQSVEQSRAQHLKTQLMSGLFRGLREENCY